MENVKNLKAGTKVFLEGNDNEVTIASYNRGWYTAKDSDVKFRPSKIVEVLESEDEETVSNGNMAQTLSKHSKLYVASVTAEGKPSLNNGDDLAAALEGLTPLQTIVLAEIICGLEEFSLQDKYSHLNPGSQRMNAGNRIRGAVNNESITLEEVAELIKKAL